MCIHIYIYIYIYTIVLIPRQGFYLLCPEQLFADPQFSCGTKGVRLHGACDLKQLCLYRQYSASLAAQVYPHHWNIKVQSKGLKPRIAVHLN